MEKKSVASLFGKNLSPRRYRHTLGCAKLADELAKIYQVDSDKAHVAALLHDVAKELSVEAMQAEIKKRTSQYLKWFETILHCCMLMPQPPWLKANSALTMKKF